MAAEAAGINMSPGLLQSKAARLLVVLVVLFGIPNVFAAESRKSLNSAARITQQAATKIALLEVPNGKIKTAELERENGKLVWSFEISMPGSANVSEVQVDAKNGAIISNVVETPEDQARALAASKLKKKKASK